MMGQQETTMTVATEERGGGTLRRTVLVLAAAALMAVMMALSAMPAMATVNPDKPGQYGGGPPQYSGGGQPSVDHCPDFLSGPGVSGVNRNGSFGNGNC